MNDDVDNNVLPVGVDSLSDYTPYKLHLLLSTPIPVNVSIPQESSLVNTDNSLNLSLNKSKTYSKRKSFIRYFIPINRSRSSSAHYEQDKYYQQQTSIQPIDDYDMRLFIIRHGERVDRYFGSDWYKQAFDQHDQYRPYHQNFPSNLPFRSNTSFWAFDTPLTLSGLKAAERLGRRLKSKHFKPTYVYSSPAMRCILTTIQILRGLKLDKKISIRIEPGLLELGAARFGMNIFFQPMDWYKYGINIDLSYQPIITNIPPAEREDEYYLRAKYVIREIERRHQNLSSELPNIFLIAHATSSETLTWDLFGKQPNVNDLYKVSLNIAYLQTVITERKQDNQLWSLKPIKWI